jgi:hypothetical protein
MTEVGSTRVRRRVVHSQQSFHADSDALDVGTARNRAEHGLTVCRFCQYFVR